METCKRPDISERIMMVLSPSDFPGEIGEIEEHLKDCRVCSEELNALKHLDTFLGANRDVIAEVLSPCPPVEILTASAEGESSDPAVEQHIAVCPDCREHVRLVRELSGEMLQGEVKPASPGEKARFLAAAAREYGPVEEPGPGLGQKLLEALRNWIQLPSLALGAAVAAVLVVFLMPEKAKETPLSPVFSNVVWAKPFVEGKGDLVTKVEPLGRKKVALLLLLGGRTQPSPHAMDEMYSKLDIVKRLGTAYDFLSPKEIKDALRGRRIAGTLTGVADLMFENTPADYLLTFEILESKTGNALRGTLFERGQNIDRGSISQTGLPISRMPSRITIMGVELLLEAEHS